MGGFGRPGTAIPMRSPDTVGLPGILPGTSSTATSRMARLPTTFGAARHARFTQQSHALGGPVASPRSVLIGTAIAVALYWIGCRLSE